MFLDKIFPKDPSIKRHILKTITWRILGTIDTIILSWIITGDPLIGVEIGLFELLTKMGLYFLHERVWYKIRYGVNKLSAQEEIQ
jgi:uncharacterized membrane protein